MKSKLIIAQAIIAVFVKEQTKLVSSFPARTPLHNESPVLDTFFKAATMIDKLLEPAVSYAQQME